MCPVATNPESLTSAFDSPGFGYCSAMTALVLIIIVLLLLGVLGTVIKGLLWLTLICALLVVAGVAYGWWKFRGTAKS